MRSIFRLAIVLATAALSVAGVAPAANAGKPITLNLYDFTGNEGYYTCPADAGLCTTTASSFRFDIAIADGMARSFPITVGWRLVDGTAIAGQDYTGPTAGTATIPAGQTQAHFTVPIVYDGFGEPTETFTTVMTSSSVPADITDTGLGTIWDGTEIPGDCTLGKSSADVVYLTCTNRPPRQTWAVSGWCMTVRGLDLIDGDPVTGNGTSTKDCGPGGAIKGDFVVYA